jgi:hypothetical protein
MLKEASKEHGSTADLQAPEEGNKLLETRNKWFSAKGSEKRQTRIPCHFHRRAPREKKPNGTILCCSRDGYGFSLFFTTHERHFAHDARRPIFFTDCPCVHEKTQWLWWWGGFLQVFKSENIPRSHDTPHDDIPRQECVATCSYESTWLICHPPANHLAHDLYTFQKGVWAHPPISANIPLCYALLSCYICVELMLPKNT